MGMTGFNWLTPGCELFRSLNQPRVHGLPNRCARSIWNRQRKCKKRGTSLRKHNRRIPDPGLFGIVHDFSRKNISAFASVN
jgi:hypothetical protein